MRIHGTGTDIVECLRIAQLIERHGELFLRRVYTPAEIEYCNARKLTTQHFAARWAAKEAVLRAMGTGWTTGFNWTNIEVRTDQNAKSTVALSGEARRKCESAGIAELHVSLAYCRTHATAHVIATIADD